MQSGEMQGVREDDVGWLRPAHCRGACNGSGLTVVRWQAQCGRDCESEGEFELLRRALRPSVTHSSPLDHNGSDAP